MSILSREEMVDLIHKAQAGDQAARETLVEANVALVKSIVKRFLGRGYDYEDLYQLGCMGLFKAIVGFKPTMETQFSTYAVPMIMGEIRRHLRDDGTIKISRTIKQLANRARAQLEEIRAITGVEPTLDRLASILEVAPDELILALDSKRPIHSLDAPIEGDDSSTLHSMIGSDDDAAITVEMKDMISRLGERERMVVIMRYYKGITQGEVAKMMGLSQAQVSRIENKALTLLREAM